MDKLSKDALPKGAQETIPEFSFEEGVKESLKRIRKNLEEKDIVVVAFSAPAINVGKTTLASRIMSELHKADISAFIKHEPADLKEGEIEEMKELQSVFHPVEKVVIIFDQCDWDVHNVSVLEQIRDLWNKEVKKALVGTSWATEKIDLWIGIFSPNKPFYKRTGNDDPALPLADILIRNEFAISKDSEP